MTREEAQKLIGGYATGSLTESERASLFNAALEDQDLFDELAAEHSLKELIDSPGARDRLVAALTPETAGQPKRVWWPWAAALAFGVAGFTVWMMKPHPVEAPVEMAQAPTDRFGSYQSVPAQQPEMAPAQAEKTVPNARAPKAKKAEETPVPEQRAATDDVEIAAAPPATVTAEQPQLKAESGEIARTITPQRIDQLPMLTIRPGAAAEAASDRSAFMAGPNAGAVVPAQPLTYVFIPNRRLRITPAQAGVLRVTFGVQTLFARNPVVARTPIELEIPEGALSVRIEFTPDGGTAFVATPSVPQ